MQEKEFVVFLQHFVSQTRATPTRLVPQAATPRNITAGFWCTGIWPINPAIFLSEDFAPSFVTDRPEQSAATTTAAVPTTEASAAASVPATQPRTTTAAALPVSADLVAAAPPAATSEPSRFPFLGSCTAGPSTSFQLFSPEAFQPYPKAGPRKGVTKGRKRKVTAIRTDTPVKKALEAAEGKKKKK
ncbi:hypothetical protein SKAU_G00326150 [Synaphobranchus kaupii]|uniref:Uncharacterized protein n=1 Tax=Synaphobranchus kaupii TaxID=118154 RepID=A0A9Q1EPP9_SYNKA|nr:hypothetical protein SKAU_G00326150 [Synaphobranchus kaupii]